MLPFYADVSCSLSVPSIIKSLKRNMVDFRAKVIRFYLKLITCFLINRIADRTKIWHPEIFKNIGGSRLPPRLCDSLLDTFDPPRHV